MPRDERSLVRDMQDHLGIPGEEAELYVAALRVGTCTPADSRERAAAEALRARGMMIVEAKGGRYLPVHPRLALSNLFRAYEERAARERKERRLLVDRLTLELITLVPGESKGTNAGGPGVGRTPR
ncbi:MAG: hypothetical protein JRM86_02130 [Nitrososphaerota archaeon]|nr:hypothetical protein [Nitrososphaerota archaeon]MDG6966600.1 hypothetical protein [Nitrososphaerota archaeon]MDG6978541.1 hypothetical protein [Nitrososphaerota archaeon]MDG7005713.1 hypothetical protein [Nitrososphaerota archaeon]MDG7021077.1 hypothetical protein [Nitrososphaerota archaeon]